MKKIVAVIGFVLSMSLTAQEAKKVRVELLVVDELNRMPLSEVVVVLDSLKLQVKTNHKGIVRLRLPLNSSYQLQFHKQPYDYLTKTITIGEFPVSIDTIVLKNNPIELELSTLFDASLESFFDGVDDSQSAYLSIGKEVIDRKSAFDWGSSFFNRRGLRSEARRVLINGLEMNRLQNGRALWGQWGGLNDFFRNQELTRPLEGTDFELSKGLGITSIDINPFGMRKGKRFSSSLSDKSYQGRLMFSMVEDLSDSFRVAVGGSVRLANRGYKEGTPYQAYAYAFHLAKKWNSKHSSSFHFFDSNQMAGKSSALSKEVVELLGRDYNPNWGFDVGEKHSAKLNSLGYKTTLFSHKRIAEKSQLLLSAMIQKGNTNRTRLYYDTAESPNPIYYKKLPSYYINSFLGANFYSANSSKESLLAQPQISWDELYTANRLHPDFVHYAILGDVEEQLRQAGFIFYQRELFAGLTWNFSLSINREDSVNYARSENLLGGEFIRDFNPFDGSMNDINAPLLKQEGDRVQYAFDSSAHEYKTLSSLSYQSNRWMLLGAFEQLNRQLSRKRKMINQRFDKTAVFHNQKLIGNQFSISSRYAINARNYIEAHWLKSKRPVNLDQYFVNPQENNRTLNPSDSYDLLNMKDLSYVMRWKALEGRISAYDYRFDKLAQNRSFYVNTSFGSVFVRELTTDLSTIHKGIEGSFKLRLSPVVELEGAWSIGDFRYNNNPHLTLELTDSIGIEGVSINDNRMDLGTANLKGYRLGNGPQKAFSLSLSYRDPKYWFTSLSFNRIADNFIAPSSVRYTESFLLDKVSLSPVDLLPNQLRIIRAQERLKSYFITNFLFGKSYLKNGTYTSVFLSVDNLLATDFKSGGYESSRYGNYRDYLDDHLSNISSFPTKYWWSSSRRFYLNLSISLP